MSAPPDPGSYRPPPIAGPTPDRDQPFRIRAVLAGIAVDWCSTLVATFAIGVMATLVAASRHQSEEEIARFLEQLGQAPDFEVLTALVGLMCVALGGFVCARLARADEVRHASLVGVASLIIGVVLDWTAEEPRAGWYPLWFQVLGHVLVIPAAIFGALVARARDDRVE